MDPAIQADFDRQQSSMLEKVSSIIDNKLDPMKRQLEKTTNTRPNNWVKKDPPYEPHTFKKKGQEQQYKLNQQVKSVVVHSRPYSPLRFS